MRNNGFTTYSDFRSAMMKHGSGLQSQVEDMADEIYQVEVAEEADSLWDAFDQDED